MDYLPAATGFAVIGTGRGPVYPSIQHMAPENFVRRFSAAAIGLQMASAYVGSTLMPMAFGWQPTSGSCHSICSFSQF